MPLLKNPVGSVRAAAISQWPKGKVMGYALRDERYRYVEWINHGDSTKTYEPMNIIGRELYDYHEDPLETVNAVDYPQYREEVKLMNQRLRLYFAK